MLVQEAGVTPGGGGGEGGGALYWADSWGDHSSYQDEGICTHENYIN